MNYHQEQWVLLWDRAKQLEGQVPIRKHDAFAAICARFPDIRYKNFGVLARARSEGRLPEDISNLVGQFKEEIDTLIVEANKCRRESAQLLEETRLTDVRKVLDPRTDIIPRGQYPKLRECKTYPLRHSCNYGNNSTSRWNRCEYMDYDNNKSIFDPNRWSCKASQ